mmetsp:Transcript_21159/g.49169  ORF Transcript_21159/g.49169 Transcript_21159/m.49169 type:complete len:433 (-) Transcript_21159:157-1455(-)|eukprot:CAMPEP_0171097670 /NCGR_PEP_ID=MMETSP0766_2-20121228/47677_1 /TAXON_ID=439317 /ORGANISM="Gambierdiscus australes, Strain CAWD 149" /LENGTH=432 /DNA_ID=CAMNT_0011556899 /DNA_START=121 /DNA_END=1419 /DNA_ORIENTATION=-
MGCVSSKAAKAQEEPVVGPIRRRLSLGEIDAEPERDSSVKEEDRALLVQLSSQQVLDFVGGKGERRYSVGSETDMGMQHVNSFASKTTKVTGDTFDAKKELIGYVCKKGLKPESPNQDSFFIMKIDGQYSIYGVFDGHGRKGHDISNFVKDHLPKILLSQENLHTDTEKALETAFEKTQVLIEKATDMKKIDAQRSGTTASVVFHDHKKGLLYLAHVGDSRVVLGRQHKQPAGGARSTWAGVDLTVDHKPDLPEERARIEQAGGMVLFDGGWNYRVYVRGKRDARGKRYPGLNMSRSMGDVAGSYDAGISAVPDVNKLTVASTPELVGGVPGENGLRPPVERKLSCSSHGSSKPSVSSYSIDVASDRFLLLCSDGVWEFISSEEAVVAVSIFKRENAMEAAEHLAGMAWKRWMNELGGQVVDDITAVVIHLG